MSSFFVDGKDRVVYRTDYEVEHNGLPTRLNISIQGSTVTFYLDGDRELNSKVSVSVEELLESVVK